MKTTIFTIPKLDKGFSPNDLLVVTAVTEQTMELRYIGNVAPEPTKPRSHWQRFKAWLRDLDPRSTDPHFA